MSIDNNLENDPREALVARLDDPDDDTRDEAIIGFARRKDARAVPAIERELRASEFGSLVLEAAKLLGCANEI